MSNLETVLSQIQALKERESQVRAALRTAETKSLQPDHDIRAALTAIRQELETLRTIKADATPDKAKQYRQMIDKLRAYVGTSLPTTAKILVASRGDNELMNLGRECWHFPQVEGGAYAGHYPADSPEAIAHLEDLRSKSANYLLIPGTSAWWLTHYVEFHRYLESRYLCIRADETCTLYGLSEPPVRLAECENKPTETAVAAPAPAPESPATETVPAPIAAVNGHHKRNGSVHPLFAPPPLLDQVRSAIEQSVPEGAMVLVISEGDEELIKLEGRQGRHFPQTMKGSHAGQYPEDSAAAIEHLEMLRTQGAAFLIIPRPAFWWLVHYEDLRRHLEARYRCSHRDRDCIIYRLGSRATMGQFWRRFSLGRIGR